MRGQKLVRITKVKNGFIIDFFSPDNYGDDARYVSDTVVVESFERLVEELKEWEINED